MTLTQKTRASNGAANRERKKCLRFGRIGLSLALRW